MHNILNISDSIQVVDETFTALSDVPHSGRDAADDIAR